MAERCPRCGSRLSPGTPLGELCPQCLFGLGLTAKVTVGRSPQISSETQSLLRGRLLVGGLVILLGVLLFDIRDLVFVDAGPVGTLSWLQLFLPRFAVLAFYAGSIALLRSGRPLTLAQLRRLEVVLLWVVALWFASDRYAYTTLAIDSASAVETVWAVSFSVITYFAFVSAYGFLIPNNWWRALRMTLPLAATPLVVLLLVAWSSQERREFLMGTETMFQVTSLALMLVIGVMIATLGAHRIHTLRIEAFEAKRLGQYLLTDRIGSGGMGEVWKAEHRLLARPAAIKLIKPDLSGIHDAALAHDFAASFEREAQATASLRSTHTVELYDFGITADSTFYYVMELLDGLDLETMVARHGPLPQARVAYLLEQVCDSLAEAHARGLVHGDIKPANIYACRMGRSFDFVKVLDFGLVKSIGPGAAPSAAGVQRGRIAGTPAYMAPEIVSERAAIDGRADIYAVGCVAYWLLTGTTLFAGTAPEDVVALHARAPVVPPSQRAGHEVAAALEELILRCLEKDPGARPQSADEVADGLAATGLAGGWTQGAARAWWEEHLAGDAPPAPAKEAQGSA